MRYNGHEITLESHFDFGETDLAITDVLAVQSLAMGYVRERAHRVQTSAKPRAQWFVILDASDREMGSGEVDTYFGVSVSKPGIREWRMVLSFLQNTYTEELRFANSREVYDFRWNGQYCTGTKRTVDILYQNPGYDITSSIDAGSVKPGVGMSTYELGPDDCIELCDRMRSMVVEPTI